MDINLKKKLIEIMEEAQKKNSADYMEYVKRGYSGKTSKPLFVEIADALLNSSEINITFSEKAKTNENIT